MIIASLDPSIKHELSFDLNISGTKDEPTDIRFIIESQPDPETGDSVQDVFSIICRAVRSPDGVKVTIPRLLNLFRSGSYKSRLEVVLEGRLFTPLSEEIEFTAPAKVEASKSIKEAVKEDPISVTIANIVAEITKPKDTETIETVVINKEEVVEEATTNQPTVIVDKTWRKDGFKGIKNPFKP